LYNYIVLDRFLFKDDILKIIQSNQYSIIQKYLEDYLIVLRNKICQYTTELTTQSTSSSLLETIDQRLIEFVQLHHLDLLRTIKYQVNKFKDHVYEKRLFKQLSYYYLSTEQVRIISQIMYIYSFSLIL
jgi:hypothetical protein